MPYGTEPNFNGTYSTGEPGTNTGFDDGLSQLEEYYDIIYKTSELWMSKALRSHPEVLATHERLRSLNILPGDTETAATTGGYLKESYGRDLNKTAHTETDEAVTPADVMQLILAYLQENDLPQTRDMLLNEAKDTLPELLDALCITEDMVPPLPPLYNNNAQELETKDGDKKQNKDKAAITRNDKFNWMLNPIYKKALVPLINLGAMNVDMKRGLFKETYNSSKDTFTPGIGKSAENSSNNNKKDDEGDSEVEAYEEYKISDGDYIAGSMGDDYDGYYYSDDDDDAKDDRNKRTNINIWDDPRKEGENVITKAVYGGSKLFVAGTFNQIVLWITDPARHERALLIGFLMFYPTVATADNLAEKLIQRARGPHKGEGTESEREMSLLALTTIRTWIEKYPEDLTERAHFHLSRFVRDNAGRNTAKQFCELHRTLVEFDGTDPKARREAVNSATEDDIPYPQGFAFEVPHVPLKKIFSLQLSLNDIDEIEIARQLCVMDYTMYWKVAPRELVGCCWSRTPESAPNVTAMIKRSEELSRWVACSILEGTWHETKPCDDYVEEQYYSDQLGSPSSSYDLSPPQSPKTQISPRSSLVTSSQPPSSSGRSKRPSLSSSSSSSSSTGQTSDHPQVSHPKPAEIEAHLSKSATLLTRFAKLAVMLVELNDFFSAYAIYSGILSNDVFKTLKIGAILNSGPKAGSDGGQQASLPEGASQAVAAVIWSGDCRENMVKLRSVFSLSNNYAVYKDMISKKVACVPAILIHLGELEMLDEGMPTFLEGCEDEHGNTLVNIQKIRVGYKMINDFLSHKEHLYRFLHVPQISALLRDVDANSEDIKELSEKLTIVKTKAKTKAK